MAPIAACGCPRDERAQEVTGWESGLAIVCIRLALVHDSEHGMRMPRLEPATWACVMRMIESRTLLIS